MISAIKEKYISFSARIKKHPVFLVLALLLIILIYFHLCLTMEQPLLSTSSWDSYTLQAKTWLSGHIELPRDFSWLELAQYNGKFYTSFPTTPTFVNLAFYPFFGGNVPSNLLVKLYTILSFFIAYFLCKKRFALSDRRSAFWSFFVVFGSNMMFMSMDGGVWFQSQTLSFLLTMTALYYILGKEAKDIHWGLIFFALAIGCRTTQILFAPVFAYYTIMFLLSSGEPFWRSVKKYAYMLIAPALIMAGYAIYNYIRFDSFTELGYRYRPEFMRVDQIMFSADYFKKNLANILRLPELSHNPTQVRFQTSEGFAFYIANPFIIVYCYRWLVALIKRQKINIDDVLGFACTILYVVTLLFFKGLGGWQFGQRYFVDFLPIILLFVLKNPKIYWSDAVIGACAVALNVFGALYLFLEW